MTRPDEVSIANYMLPEDEGFINAAIGRARDDVTDSASPNFGKGIALAPAPGNSDDYSFDPVAWPPRKGISVTAFDPSP